jgi:hypothetical protein
VKRPIKRRKPPMVSRMAPIQKREKAGGKPDSGGAGQPNSFCVPCSMKISAVTIRSTARAYGA